jgi:hypothetical protein
MPFNVLILPLLGGYIFTSCWNPTRFSASRYSGQRLLLHAAVAGLVWLTVAFLLTILLAPRTAGFSEWWSQLVPFEYAGTSLLSFLLGAVAWAPANLFFDRDQYAARAVEMRGDFLEILLDKALEETEQIMVTLSNGKVYVGFVTSNVDPSFDRKYMRMMPMLSGYRDEHTKDFVITNDYARVYQELITEESPELENADRFQLVIPVQEIMSASLFDPDVYTLFTIAEQDSVAAGGAPG